MRVRPAFHCLAVIVATAILPSGASTAGVAAVGLKGGVSVATVHGRLPTDPFLNNGSRTAFAGGASLTVQLTRRIALQAEALLAPKGTSLGSVDLTDPAGNVLGTAQVAAAFDYVEFPLLVRVDLHEQGVAWPYLLVGPSLSLRRSQQLRLSGGSSVTIDLDFVRRSDLGVALGAGLDVGRHRTRGLLETRYTLGLTDATDARYSDSARNGALLLMAGLSYRP